MNLKEKNNFFKSLEINDFYVAKGKVHSEKDSFHYVAKVTDVSEAQIWGDDIWSAADFSTGWVFDLGDKLNNIDFDVLEKVSEQTHPELFL